MLAQISEKPTPQRFGFAYDELSSKRPPQNGTAASIQADKDAAAPGALKAEAPQPGVNGKTKLTEHTEEELIELARQGDTDAFGELINHHYFTCLKRAASLIRNPTDAEDEVQNACWKAFERLSQYRGEGTFAAWLSRIVENQCLMRIREDRQAHFLYLDQSSESSVRLELVAQIPGPEDELGDQQLENLLRREIARIPPLLRNVMVLSDIEHLPMPDVAARLGVSIAAAKSRLGRARVELRARLKKHCGKRGVSTLTHKPQYGRLAYTRGA